MSVELTRDTKVATAERLYQALAKGDVDALNQLLAADFVGHAAQGLPLGMGGTHVGPMPCARSCGGVSVSISRHVPWPRTSRHWKTAGWW